MLCLPFFSCQVEFHEVAGLPHLIPVPADQPPVGQKDVRILPEHQKIIDYSDNSVHLKVPTVFSSCNPSIQFLSKKEYDIYILYICHIYTVYIYM